MQQIRQENPTSTDLEVGEKLVEIWNYLDNDERAVYKALSKKDQDERKRAKEF